MARNARQARLAAEWIAEAESILARVTDASSVDTWTREVAIRRRIVAEGR